jgi:hypothetical protein
MPTSRIAISMVNITGAANAKSIAGEPLSHFKNGFSGKRLKRVAKPAFIPILHRYWDGYRGKCA